MKKTITKCAKCETGWTGRINRCPECSTATLTIDEILESVLQPRQWEVYKYLKNNKHGKTTLEEMRKVFKLKNQNSIAFAVDSLIKKKLIQRDKYSRAITVTTILLNK